MWWKAWLLILTIAALITGFAIVERLLVGQLPWNAITRPEFWKLPVSLFLVAALAAFCVMAETLSWFGRYRKTIQGFTGLCLGIAIALLFSGSDTTVALAAIVGCAAGYFGEHWGKGL